MKMNLFRKIAVLGLALLFVLPGLPAGAETPNESDRSREIAAVMDYLLGDGYFVSESVTRAEFTGALMHAFALHVDGYTSAFSDVKEETPYAAEISAALAAGLVSPAEQFEPLQPLEYEHAVKMVVHALGYEALAAEYGGYPQGYIKAARNLDLLDRVPREDGGMSTDSARTLIYNLLTSTIRCTGVSKDEDGDYFRFEKTDINYLESLHNLRQTEGIVTATQYNSYRPGAALMSQPCIEIDGISYQSAQSDPALLGSNVRMYYNVNTKRAEVVVPFRNREIEVDLRDVSRLDLNTLQYNDPVSGRSKTYQTGGSIIIYNGRAVDTLDFESVLQESGAVRLLDNDNDGKYEYLFLTCYQYLYVDRVDVRGESVSDAHAAENGITADPANTALILRNESGGNLEFSDIKSDNLLIVERSMDNALITARLCTQMISGTITRTGTEDEIYIDGVSYRLSTYARAHYAAQMIPGSKGSFLLGYNNEIVVLKGSGTEMQYGYLIDGAAVGVFDGEVKLKIYTQGGELAEFTADKLRIDNSETKVSGSAILAAVSQNGAVQPQLIRYCTDAEGKIITYIDLAATDFDFTKQPEDDKDSLRKFTFTNAGAAVTTFNYRSGGKSCSPYFNLNNSVVFSVPKDDVIKSAEKSDFLISDASGLTSNRNYPFEVYDLNEGGTAGAVVLKGERVASGRNYMIESVARGILPDETTGTIIQTYGYQRYETFYITNEVEEESLNKELCAGDIVELISDGDKMVQELKLVFDASSGLPVPNTGAGGGILFENANNISYFYGALYAADSTYGYLSKTEDGAGGYRYNWSDLINLKLQTSNMALINAKRNEIRPITMKELKDYKSFGNNNYYVVVRLSYQAPDAVYVYER